MRWGERPLAWCQSWGSVGVQAGPVALHHQLPELCVVLAVRVTVLAHTAVSIRSSAFLLPKPSFAEVYYLSTEVSLQHLSHACASMDSMSAHGNDEIWFFLREVNRCQRQQYLRDVSGSADVCLNRCMVPSVIT